MRLPVDNAVITSHFGERILNEKKEFHKGVDLISRQNNKVFSCLPGIIVHDQDDYNHAKRFTDHHHSAGNYLIIKHQIGKEVYYFRYLHLGQNYFKIGDQIAENVCIGFYGDYGYSFGAHVHIDAYNSKWQLANIEGLFKINGLL